MSAEKSKQLSCPASMRYEALLFLLHISFFVCLCILVFHKCVGHDAENVVQLSEGIQTSTEFSSSTDKEIYILSIDEVRASSVAVKFAEKHNGGLCIVAAFDEKGAIAASVSCPVNEGQRLVQMKMDIPATPAVYEIQAHLLDRYLSEQFESEPVTSVMYLSLIHI